MMTAERPIGPAIDATDLVKTYPGGIRALDGVDIHVEQGSVFALLGPNGAGKSTAVRILTTLSRSDSGRAIVAGFDVERSPDRVRRVIGMVSQRSAVDPAATGRENLALQGRVHSMRGRDLDRRMDDLLGRFALRGAADRLVQTYSGGMQRRLDVAMALVHRPAVLFLDEPTTGLDPEARAELWSEIGHLAREDGLAVLLTTHYLEEADRLAGRVAIVDQGRIVADGTPDELKAGLRGDAVTVGLRDGSAGGRAAEILSRLPGLAKPTFDGPVLRARAEHGASAVPAVLAALDGAGIPVDTVTVARPSLDDVYLRHTGRTFRPIDLEVPR